MLLKNFMQDYFAPVKGSVKIPMKGYIEEMRERYHQVTEQEKKPYLYDVYKVMPGDRLTIHVKVPSRSLTKFYYDVLLELEPVNKAKTMEDCHVRFFSNSPSFIYSGLPYLLSHMDSEGNMVKSTDRPILIGQLKSKIPADRLTIPSTEEKYGDKALKEPPVKRNPLGIPMLDSSVYTSIIFLEDVTTLDDLTRKAHRITDRQLLSNIPNFDQLMSERTRLVNKEKREKERQKKLDDETVKTNEKRATSKRTSSVKMMKPIAAKKPISAKSPMKPKGFKK